MNHRSEAPARGRPLTALLGALLVLVLVADTARAEILRLKDGTLIHGELLSFDEGTGITVQRVDTGGVLELLWEHLPADEVRRIKASRGFTGEDPEPYLVSVVHLVLRNGTTESGIPVDSDDPALIALQRRGDVDSFPRSEVAQVQTGKMEGLEVLTRDELYLRLLEENGAPTDGQSNLDLAIACEGAGLFEQSREHYQAVGELEPGLKPELVASKLAYLAIKIEDAAETAELEAIRTRLYKKQFELAAEMAAEFRRTYPDSRQLADLQVLESDIARRKRDYHGRGIVSDYFALLDKRLARLARDASLSLEVVQNLAETAVHEEILASLAEEYVLSEDTVQELWDERPSGSVRSFTYGTGTFILGKTKALEFGRFDDEEDELAAADEEQLEADFDDLVEQVKRQRQKLKAERQAAGRGSSALDDEGPTPDEWWTGQSSEDKARWLSAWFAEMSGQVRVIEARGRPCRHCDARGYLEGTDEDGEPIQITCPVCKDLKYERLVRCR